MDRGQIIDCFARFLPVGFYYKAFHKPAQALPVLRDGCIRKVAGLGYVDARRAQRRHCRRATTSADVLVVGAGPSGLAAALAAGEAGAKVVLVDENARPGGTLTYARALQPGGGCECSPNCSGGVEESPNVEYRADTVAGGTTRTTGSRSSTGARG